MRETLLTVVYAVATVGLISRALEEASFRRRLRELEEEHRKLKKETPP